MRKTGAVPPGPDFKKKLVFWDYRVGLAPGFFIAKC